MSIKRIVTSFAIASSVLAPVAVPAATFANGNSSQPAPKSSLFTIGDINILDQNPFLNNSQYCSNISLVALLQGNKCVYN